MNYRFLTVIAALPIALGSALSAEGPQVTIERVEGVPEIQISQTQRTCPAPPKNHSLRQEILNVAAREWSEFSFPRFSLQPLSGYNVMPPGISPAESKTRASGGYVARVLPVGAMEDDAAVRTRIGRYWASIPQEEHDRIFWNQNAIWKASRGRAGWAEYWSAAFVSYVMCMAGLSTEAFKRSALHLSYIAPAVERRDGSRPDYAYTAFDIHEALPAPGDLICAAREDNSNSINNLESFRRNTKHSAFHCDIVVGFDNREPRNAGVVYAIGGNVINAVSLTETPMGNGRLIPLRTPHSRNWFTVLKLDSSFAEASFRRVPGAILSRAEEEAKKWRRK